MTEDDGSEEADRHERTRSMYDGSDDTPSSESGSSEDPNPADAKSRSVEREQSETGEERADSAAGGGEGEDEPEQMESAPDSTSGDETAPSGGPAQQVPGMVGGGPRHDDQLVSADSEPDQATGTFFVKHVEDFAVTLHEVDTGQIFTVIENPGLEPNEIIEASLIAQPPMEVSYLFDEIHSRRTIPVQTLEESPTGQTEQIAGEMEPGQAVAIEREGEGEIHVLTVEPEETETTVDELTGDEMTYKNAARYGVARVELRWDAEAGIVAVRYLPA